MTTRTGIVSRQPLLAILFGGLLGKRPHPTSGFATRGDEDMTDDDGGNNEDEDREPLGLPRRPVQGPVLYAARQFVILGGYRLGLTG